MCGIRTKKINNITIQENGIIRNSEGYIIGRLSNDIPFDSDHINGKEVCWLSGKEIKTI